MSILKKAAIGLLVIIGIFLVVGLFLPSKYQVDRERVIAQEASVLFGLVHDLNKWKEWSPWIKEYPNDNHTFSANSVGPGAYYTWKGEETGEGKLEIVSSTANKAIKTKLAVKDRGTGIGDWSFTEKDGKTTVVWSFKGDNGNNIIGKYFGLMMDGMLGPYFERGLANIEQVASSTK